MPKPTRKGGGRKGRDIQAPVGEVNEGPLSSPRTIRKIQKDLNSLHSDAVSHRIDLYISSFADLLVKMKLCLNAYHGQRFGIRIIRTSMTWEELNADLRAKFASEKDLQDHLAELSDRMEKDETLPEIDFCIRVEDALSQVLFQYFAFEDDQDPTHTNRRYVGIPHYVCKDVPMHMQALMHTYPAGKRSHVGDSRHDVNNAKHRFLKLTGRMLTMKTTDRLGNSITTEVPEIVEVEEGNGLLHLSQAWPPQGHPSDLRCSCDFLGGGVSQRFHAGQTCLSQTWDIQKHVAMRLKAVDPHLYAEVEKDFKAGKQVAKHIMPGPYLSVAYLYKLQVGIHRDTNDYGLSAMVNFGSYTGGNLHVPQLGLKLKYQPGDVCFLRAMDLYHEVRKWQATPKMLGSSAEPGRVSMVFFNNKDAHNVLKDKKKGWLSKNGGSFAYTAPA
ncbi:hypothetical protein SCHPADRAFT_944832 [Schizopora paradoxa]|uniref:Uncharacterized protein n=1 Tax=Schizopora paradoxa TaxID=27342 RepID=A0A0H2REL2_9AGAM|nr:hypothetical protein SCHPADRAFT_944832 [Schizopora paradoxa]